MPLPPDCESEHEELQAADACDCDCVDSRRQGCGLCSLRQQACHIVAKRHSVARTCCGGAPGGAKQKLPAATKFSGCGSKSRRSASRSAPSSELMCWRDSGASRAIRSVSLCGGPAVEFRLRSAKAWAVYFSGIKNGCAMQ